VSVSRKVRHVLHTSLQVEILQIDTQIRKAVRLSHADL
jgi:hypothetical protein